MPKWQAWHRVAMVKWSCSGGWLCFLLDSLFGRLPIWGGSWERYTTSAAAKWRKQRSRSWCVTNMHVITCHKKCSYFVMTRYFLSGFYTGFFVNSSIRIRENKQNWKFWPYVPFFMSRPILYAASEHHNQTILVNNFKIHTCASNWFIRPLSISAPSQSSYVRSRSPNVSEKARVKGQRAVRVVLSKRRPFRWIHGYSCPRNFLRVSTSGGWMKDAKKQHISRVWASRGNLAFPHATPTPLPVQTWSWCHRGFPPS